MTRLDVPRPRAYRFVARMSRAIGAVHPTPRPGLRVLLYHAVGSHVPHDTYGMSVSPPAFHEQMRWLREESGHALVPLEAACADVAGAARKGTAVAVTFDDGFRDVLTAAAPVLARYRIPFTVFVVGRYLDQPPVPGQYLDRTALRELAAVPGASVGAHGFAHRPLDRLGPAALDDDLWQSRQSLCACLGVAPTTMAYPYGAVNAGVAERARAAGFLVGGTSFTGVNHPRVDPLRIRRTEIVAADGLEEFSGKVHGYYDWYRVRQRLSWPAPRD